jgi:hypothetical protein
MRREPSLLESHVVVNRAEYNMFASHSAPWQKRIDRYDDDRRAELTVKTHIAEKRQQELRKDATPAGVGSATHTSQIRV